MSGCFLEREGAKQAAGGWVSAAWHGLSHPPALWPWANIFHPGPQFTILQNEGQTRAVLILGVLWCLLVSVIPSFLKLAGHGAGPVAACVTQLGKEKGHSQDTTEIFKGRNGFL